MIEQTRDRQRINLVFNERLSTLLTRKPTYQRVEIIDENCTMHVMRKTKVVLNKPILTGNSYSNTYSLHNK